MMDAVTWMNANKAIELGFADAILEDNKKKVSNESYEFQAHAFATNLLNKISSKTIDTSKPMNKGRSVDELKNKLNQIKNYI